MSIYYCGTDGNKLLVVQVNDNNEHSASTVLQEISPVAPNPLQLPEGVYNGIATEWVVRHPTLPYLFVLTSYWNAMESCVTTFCIQLDGRLTRVGDSVSTRGLHAAHACISPDGSLLVIAHHNDGKLVFFDINMSQDDKEHHHFLLNPIQGQPCCTIDTPEVICNTRRIPRRQDACPGLPSLHHIQYAPNNSNQRYLLTVDPSQDYIFTYRIDARGLPTSGIPVSSFACYSQVPIYGWFQWIITHYVLKCQQRTRKAVVHPNGKYVYVIYESINRLQVYSIDKDGVIDKNKNGCWQDVSTLEDEPCNRSPSWCPAGVIGMTLQCASELCVSPDGSTLWVANRGDVKVPGISRGESSICIFSIKDNGRHLVRQGALPGIMGPVRHFLVLPETATTSSDKNNVKIVAGICQPTQPKHPSCLQTFVQMPNNNPSKYHDDKEQSSSEHKRHELHSVANTGTNVFCIAH